MAVNNTSDLFLKNGLDVRDNGIFHSDVHIRGSLIVDGQTAAVNTVKLTTKDKNIDLFVVDSDGFGVLQTTAWGNDNEVSGGGFTLWSSDTTGNKTWEWQKVYNTKSYTWVTNQSGIQSTQPTFNLLSTLDTTTVNFADKTRTLNIAATATAALAADIGPALTGNVINFSTTAAGTHTIQSEIRTGTQNLYQQITGGTMNLGVTPGTTTTGTGTLNVWGSGQVNIGQHATATTTVDIGGAISGNTLRIDGTAAGTTNIRTGVVTGTNNFLADQTSGTLNIADAMTAGTSNFAQNQTGTTNLAASGTVNIGDSTSATTTVNFGGDISGNTLHINGTTAGTANVTTDSNTINLINTTTKVLNFAGATETLNVQNGQFLYEKQASVASMGGTPLTNVWVMTGTGYIDAGTF